VEFFRRVDEFDTVGVTWIGACCDANVEAVAAQNPDLIVTDTFSGADQYDQLVQIAPVVRIDPFGQPLVEALEQWAELAGRADVAAERRSVYRARVDEVIAAIGEPGAVTVAMVTSWDGGATWGYVDGDQATRQVIDDLTVARPDQWDAAGEFSLEQFPDHAADVVVVYDFGGREAPDAEIDAFVGSPVFRAHPAVAAGQWARVDATQTVGSGWSKLANLLDVLEPLLADPALDRSIDP
jgi:iron complex transport system substrate-binding protein